MVSRFEGRNHFKPERSISETHRTRMDINRCYESIHRRIGFLIRTNQSNHFYGPFKEAALPTESDPCLRRQAPMAEWVSPIPLSGLSPSLSNGLQRD